MVAPVKACNFANIRLRHSCIFVKFLKLLGTYFDPLLDFLKIHKNTGEKIFAKYLPANGCFVKTNTINCDDNGNTMFPNTRAFACTRQPMKRNFTWSTKRSICVTARPFKNIEDDNLIAPTDTSFCKYRNHAKILIVFKRWCNCLILCEIIFQLEILRD